MNRPNILIIVTDQLSWQALPASGNRFCRTPNIDRIMNRGVRFDTCYTACPLCQPSRASFWTGRFPHESGIVANGKKFPVPRLSAEVATLGELLQQAGYETVHFGKAHDAGSLRGFEIEPLGELPVEGTPAWPAGNSSIRDRYTTEKTVQYLRTGKDKPFCAVADLINPHDICDFMNHNKGVHEDVPIDGPLPALPDNFDFDDIANRPVPVQYICCSHNRQAQAAGWTRDNFRHYLAAYYHYVAVVDREIGRILDALEQRADHDDTLVVFLSDHGDGMAAHGLVTKQVSFYEETTHVPLAFAGAGVRGAGRVVSGPLVSLLDLLPTLCEVAQVDAPGGLWGRSLVPWLEDPARGDEVHPYIACEWHTEWGFTIEPGRMIRTPGYKYIRYVEAEGEEFYDLAADGGETRNRINDTGYSPIVNDHRQLLAEHCRATKDDFFSLSWLADERWRSHPVGYHHHVGPAAPMVE